MGLIRYIGFPKIRGAIDEWKDNYWKREAKNYPQKPAGGKTEEMLSYIQDKAAFQRGFLDNQMKIFKGIIEQVLEQEKAKRKGDEGDILYLVVFPEGTFSDVERPEKISEKKEINQYYLNPLYMENVEYIIKDNPTFRELSGVDVMICPGSFWWKIKDVDISKEKLFNSAPLFYQGKCIFMWDKQILSAVDGAGDPRKPFSESKQQQRWANGRIAYFEEQLLTGNKKFISVEDLADELVDHDHFIPYLSPLTQEFNLQKNNQVEFYMPSGERKICMELDICRDIFGDIGKRTAGKEPDLQLVLAYYLTYAKDNMYEKATRLICDGYYGRCETYKSGAAMCKTSEMRNLKLRNGSFGNIGKVKENGIDYVVGEIPVGDNAEETGCLII